jgi:hypothetical protein
VSGRPTPLSLSVFAAAPEAAGDAAVDAAAGNRAGEPTGESDGHPDVVVFPRLSWAATSLEIAAAEVDLFERVMPTGRPFSRCLSVPGVIEVNTFGGQLKTYEI